MLTSTCCPRPVTSRASTAVSAAITASAADVERLVAAAAHRRERVVVVAAAPHRAPTHEEREVGGGLVGAGAGATERRDRDPDELLVAGAEVGVVETEGGERVGRLALEHDVGLGREPAEVICPGVGGEVEHDAALGRVVVPPPEAALGVLDVVGERVVCRREGVTARRLDHDDVGPEVAEHLPGERGMLRRQLDDASPASAPLT